MTPLLESAGCLFVAAVFVGLAVVGQRDKREGIRPDVLPDELREGLGLWRDVNLGEGSVRDETAFLSPQFRNSRQVLLNVLTAAIAFVGAVTFLVTAIRG